MAVTITPDMESFMEEWSILGGPVAQSYDLPVSAMVACASLESNWGKGEIYLSTLNPFSLQKWPHVVYPVTYKVFWHITVVHVNPKQTKKAPFACATDRGDAVRQWCEWILHWGDADGPPGNPDPKTPAVASHSAIAARDKLLKQRKNGYEFAMLLPTVGFGETITNPKYAKRLSDFSMDKFD